MSLKLIKRGNVYHVTGTVYGETLRKTTKTSDKRLAEEIMSRWEREIRDRHVFGTRAAVGFSEAVEAYLEYGEDRFMSAVVAAFKDTPVTHIDQAMLDREAKKAYPDAANSTLNRQFYTPFIAVMNYAAEQDWRPVRKWRRPEQPKGNTDWREPEEIEALLNESPDYLQRAIIIYIGTMMRATEGVTLDSKNVARDGSRVVLWDEDTKGGYTRSVEPLSRAREVLKGLEPGPVLRQRDGNPWHAYDAVNLALKRACARAKIRKLSCHKLRHTGATWRYALDPDLPRLMGAGGWKSLSMVQRYTHMATRDLRERLIAHGWSI